MSKGTQQQRPERRYHLGETDVKRVSQLQTGIAYDNSSRVQG